MFIGKNMSLGDTLNHRQWNLSLSDTNALKGIALILLLCHHLFYIQDGSYNDILVFGKYPLVQEFGLACKVCVAIFVFLSGYGLAMKYSHTLLNIREFYATRFTKLMMGYWFVWLLFIPVGILFFDRTPEVVYHNHIVWKFLADFLGLAYNFGFYGFNPTWWFMSCILVLYLLFPLLFKLCRRYWLFLLVISVGITWIPLYVFNPIKYYLFTFLIGIICVQKGLFDRLFCMAKPVFVRNLLGGGKLLIISIVLFTIRRLFPYPLFFDSILTLLFVMSYLKLTHSGKLTKWLEFLGRHSMNIFLFHTFIFLYYFHDIVYCSGNPFLIFLTLLCSCLAISMGMEYLKKAIRFDVFCKQLIRKLK